MLAQYIIGLFVLRTGVGYDIFKWIADRAGDLLGFAKDGVAFLTNEATANLGMFFFGVIPAIICECTSSNELCSMLTCSSLYLPGASTVLHRVHSVVCAKVRWIRVLGHGCHRC